MAPSDYIQSRELSQQHPNNDNLHFTTLVDGRPYLPNLKVDASDTNSVCNASLVMVLLAAYVAANANDSASENSSKGTKKEGNLNIINLSIDWDSIFNECSSSLSCIKVTGGITNALFRVSGFQSILSIISNQVKTLLSSNNSTNTPIDINSFIDYNSILVRIFGAEGMINRDIETSTYAALCNVNIAYRYLGRFGNGRMEGWLEGYQPLNVDDLTEEGTSLGIAKEMARLHCLFEVPAGELRDHHYGVSGDRGGDCENGKGGEIQVGLWDQLSSWMNQAKGYSEFRTKEDTERVKKLDLDDIEKEVNQFIQSFDSTNGDEGANQGGNIVFCHNDLLSANIMRHSQTNKIQLIDFEYGGTNYAAFDMANHFNEHAGGTSTAENGQTDYTRFPTVERQKRFCEEYVRTIKRLESDIGRSEVEDVEVVDETSEEIHNEATELLNQVHKFILINHLYWGLWAVNQGAEEGCEEFDYIKYAGNRFKEFRSKKAEWESVQLD